MFILQSPLRAARFGSFRLRASVLASLVIVGTARAWTPPLNLTRNAGDAGTAAHTIDSAGRAHLIVGRNGQQLWTLRVEDQVQTDWSMLVSSGGVSPALAADNQGRVHAFYSKGFEIQYQQWSNGSWSAPLQVSGGGGDANKPQACVDSQNNVHVVWGAGGQVWYNRRAAATGQWDGATQIPGAGDLELYLAPHIATVGTAPVVVYGKHNGGSWNAWFASKETGSWVNTLLDGNAGCSNGDLTASADGTIDVGWDRNYDLFLLRRSGGVWQPSYSRTGASDSLGPRLSAITSTSVDATWRENSDIFSSHWNGTSWSSAGSVTGGAGGVSQEIKRDAGGRQYVIWSRDWDIWLTTSTALPDPAPPTVSGAAAVPATSQVALNWTNPKAYDLANVRIVWRTDHAPTGPTDGTIILSRPASWGPDTFLHTGASNGINHYYGMYVTDLAGQPSALSVVSARPTLKQDFDNDGDVDQTDFAHLQACLTGPAIPIADPACDDADLNGDNYVSTLDLDALLVCFAGPDILPPDTCSPF